MVLAHVSDVSLMQEIASREVAALGELYDRYANVNYSLAMRMLGDPAAARTVVLEAFRQVWDQADVFKPSEATVATFLTTLVHDRAIASLQRQRMRTRTEDTGAERPDEGARPQLPDLDPVGDRDQRADDVRIRVRDMWRALPREQRRTVELAYFQGYAQQDIARLTGESPATVMEQLEACMNGLCALVQDEQRD